MILFITLVVISISLYFTFTSPNRIVAEVMGFVGAFAVIGLVYFLMTTFTSLSDQFGKGNVLLILFIGGLVLGGIILWFVLKRIDSEATDELT